MAEEEKKQEEKKQPEKQDGKTFLKLPMMLWIILGVLLILGLGGGFALAQLLAKPTVLTPPEDQTNRPQTFNDLVESSQDQPMWYFSLEPAVANLNEPGSTRFVRTTVTLVLDPEMDQTKGQFFLEERADLLTDWLNLYLAGLKLEDVRGTENLRRIKMEITDHFNEILFPDSKPYVKEVLLKEFAVS